VAPAFALRRAIARNRLNRILDGGGARAHSAIGGGRNRTDFITTSASPDSMIYSDIEKLRNQVRQREYEDGTVRGPIKRIVNNVVGRGILFQAAVKADESGFEFFPSIDDVMAARWNFYLEHYWRLWVKAENADVKVTSSFHEIQKQVQGALIRDGESIVVVRESNRRNRLIPVCLEVLEADRLFTPPGEITNPLVRNGIRFDSEGAPAAYYLLKHHPGDRHFFQTGSYLDFDEVPAFNANGTRRVLHLFDLMRPEQTRGFSEFAPALKDLQDLDRYEEAEKFAAIEDACMMGFVKSANPNEYQAATTEADPGSDRRLHDFDIGMIHYLAPGEEMDIHRPKRPNDQFEKFTAALTRGPANALDMPPEVLSQNWAGMNYSNARTVLLQWHLSCRMRQQFLFTHLCDPVADIACRQFVARGLIPDSRGFDRRPADFLRRRWQPGGWEWVDPTKEAQGKQMELDGNFATLASVCAEKGEDWEEVLEQRAREAIKIRDIEEKHDIKLSTAAPATAETPAEDMDDEDKKAANA